MSPGVERQRISVVYDRVARLFAIDLRSLACFRISVASALLIDVVWRSRDLVAHYTEAGVLPVQPPGGLQRLSLHAWLSADPLGVSALFAIAALAAVALLVGWRTRLATVMSWYLLASLLLRNPAISRMGGDAFLRMLLFWGMLLPLGARFSLDARRRGEARGAGVLRSVPAAALLVQIALLYVATGFLKDGPAWRTGRGLWYSLHLDYWVTPLGVALRRQEAWLVPLSWAALWFERLGALVAFVPLHNDAFRMLAVVLFLGFHLSLAALIDVGPFPLFCLAAWPAFLPSRLWDDWLPRWRGRRSPSCGPPPVINQPAWVQALAAGLLVYVGLYVATESRRPGLGLLPPFAKTVGSVLRLNQRWTMFSPDPGLLDQWPLVEGIAADGRRLDLLRGGNFALSKPQHIAASLPGIRWRLLFRATMDDWRDYRESPRLGQIYDSYARYLCASWQPPSGEAPRLVAVRIYHGLEPTFPSGPLPPSYEQILEHRCGTEGRGGGPR